jgi:hypothetical protein
MSVGVLDEWAGQDLIPLPGLSDALERAGAVGMDANARHYAIRKGIITPAVRVNGRPCMVTWEDALLIVLAATMAVAAGIALVSALRALRNTGAQVSGDVVTISLSRMMRGDA